MTGTVFDGPAPVIARDRLPVTVSDAHGNTWVNARAVLTMPDDTGTGVFLVWDSPHPRNPVVNTTWDLAGSRISRRTSADWVVYTPDGLYTLSGRGCGGCSPLAAMPWPWPTYRMGVLPT